MVGKVADQPETNLKAEHISIALALEDVPNIGRSTAKLLRECGVISPADLVGVDAGFLYDKICQITRKTHNITLLDVLLSAVHFAEGHPPRHHRHFRQARLELLEARRSKS